MEEIENYVEEVYKEYITASSKQDVIGLILEDTGECGIYGLLNEFKELHLYAALSNTFQDGPYIPKISDELFEYSLKGVSSIKIFDDFDKKCLTN